MGDIHTKVQQHKLKAGDDVETAGDKVMIQPIYYPFHMLIQALGLAA
jgi:hypothetical protein